MKKATGVGSVARINPPSTPPMIRATFMCRKLRAVALETADGGTRSLTIAIVAGDPIVSAIPSSDGEHQDHPEVRCGAEGDRPEQHGDDAPGR